MRERWLVTACGVGLAIFVACNSVAIALYPGGTWFNRNAPGHSFAKNFLCDLMQTQALNGQPAPLGSLLARLGMAAVMIAMASFFVQIAEIPSPPTRVSRTVLYAGLLSCALGLLVPLLTSDQFRDLHIVSVVAAFVPGLVACIAALLICLRAPGLSRAIRVLAIVTLAAGALDGVMYAFVYASPLLGIVPGSRSTRALIGASLPLLQRIATLGLMAWVVAVCVHTFNASRRDEAAA